MFAGQNHNIKIESTSFKNVTKLMHLGITVTNQNMTDRGIKSRLDVGNAWYHSDQNLLSFRLLSKKDKLKI
jgi:L-lysine 2,3-aminomutase